MGGGLQALLVFALTVVILTCCYIVWFVHYVMNYLENGKPINQDKKNQAKKQFYKAWGIIMLCAVAIALLSMFIR